jgi:hypothetical protein
MLLILEGDEAEKADALLRRMRDSGELPEEAVWRFDAASRFFAAVWSASLMSAMFDTMARNCGFARPYLKSQIHAVKLATGVMPSRWWVKGDDSTVYYKGHRYAGVLILASASGVRHVMSFEKCVAMVGEAERCVTDGRSACRPINRSVSSMQCRSPQTRPNVSLRSRAEMAANHCSRLVRGGALREGVRALMSVLLRYKLVPAMVAARVDPRLLHVRRELGGLGVLPIDRTLRVSPIGNIKDVPAAGLTRGFCSMVRGLASSAYVQERLRLHPRALDAIAKKPELQSIVDKYTRYLHEANLTSIYPNKLAMATARAEDHGLRAVRLVSTEAVWRREVPSIPWQIAAAAATDVHELALVFELGTEPTDVRDPCDEAMAVMTACAIPEFNLLVEASHLLDVGSNLCDGERALLAADKLGAHGGASLAAQLRSYLDAGAVNAVVKGAWAVGIEDERGLPEEVVGVHNGKARQRVLEHAQRTFLATLASPKFCTKERLLLWTRAYSHCFLARWYRSRSLAAYSRH